MSVKLDANSNILGSYETNDLYTFMWPEKKQKGRRRVRRRVLEYHLVWSITEMQVKTFVRAIIPNPTGPLTMQLAQERPLGRNEMTYGESRSQALVKDIQVSSWGADHAALNTSHPQSSQNRSNDVENSVQDQRLNDIIGPSGRQLVNDLATQYQQPRAAVAQMTENIQAARPAQMTNFRHATAANRTTEPLGVARPSRSALQYGLGAVDEAADVSFIQISMA